MFFPKQTVILSPDARADFTDILVYTLQQWGAEQRDRYELALTEAIASLSDFPEAGAVADRAFPGCRFRRVRRHIIFYRIGREAIEVVRILHDRADPTRHVRS